jgi:hypothetical protein
VVRFSTAGPQTEAAVLLKVNGAKTLVLDASLAGPLGLVIEVSLLKVWNKGSHWESMIMK